MLSSIFKKCVTLETDGSRLPQREEDVAHDGGTADTRGSDDAEDVVHVVTQVLLKQSGVPRLTPSPQGTHTHIITPPDHLLLPCLCPGSPTLSAWPGRFHRVCVLCRSAESRKITETSRCGGVIWAKWVRGDVPHLWWAWAWPADSASPPVSSSHQCTWRSASFLGKWCSDPYAAEGDVCDYSKTELAPTRRCFDYES